MTDNKPPASALVLVVLCGALGAGAVLFTYSLIAEYGPTSGSWTDGAVEGLRFAMAALLVVALLAALAFWLGRRSTRIRVLVLAVVALTVGGVMVAGGQATLSKYDQLPRLPHCDAADYPDSPAFRSVVEAFEDLDHPGPFGTGSSSTQACAAELLNSPFDKAASHYRDQLSAAGWTITEDDDLQLAAHRDDLVFVLAGDNCGLVTVTIRLAESGDLPRWC